MNGKKSATRRGLTTLTTAVLSLALLTVVGCKGAPASKAATTPPAMLVGPENIAVVKGEQLRSGPAISGTLQPEQQANVRAEVGGTILQTSAEAGQRVSRGQTLARIDDATLQESVLSAQAAATTAQNTSISQAAGRSQRGAAQGRRDRGRDLEMSQNQLSARRRSWRTRSRCSPTPTSS
jgi:multidrug efflux pump subunit AcrA (membrane-fusion protein)